MKEIYVVYEIKDFYDGLYFDAEYIGSDTKLLKAFEVEEEAREMVRGKSKTYYKKIKLVKNIKPVKKSDSSEPTEEDKREAEMKYPLKLEEE